MKYQEIDPKFLERYFTMLGNKDRKVDKKYKGTICQRDVFVRRTLGKWLKDKCYAVIDHRYKSVIDEEYNVTEIHSSRKFYVYVKVCVYGYSSYDTLNLYIDYADNRLENDCITLNHNDMIGLQFKEITIDEYLSIKSLFIDDREEKEYEIDKCFSTVGKRRKLVEVVVKSKGRDYKEARKNAAKNNPNLIIHC